MKRLIAAALAFPMVACALLAQQPKQQWKEYFFPRDSFAIDLPYAVTPHADAGDNHIMVYTVRLEQGTVVSLRAITRATDCESTLADMWDQADKGGRPPERVVPNSLKEVSLSGLRGLEYVTELQGARSLHRFHCGNGKFYIFSVGYKTKQRPQDVDRLINSFRSISPVTGK